MGGAILLLPLYTFMTWTGTTLCFYRVAFLIYLVVRKQDNLIFVYTGSGSGCNINVAWHFKSDLTTKIFIQVLKFTLLAYTNE